MNELKNIKLIKSGSLKYDRLKSISILRHKLNDFGFNYTIKEVKNILDNIINNSYTEEFDGKFQHCINSIFSDNIYDEFIENKYDNDCCFPENYIMPTAP